MEEILVENARRSSTCFLVATQTVRAASASRTPLASLPAVISALEAGAAAASSPSSAAPQRRAYAAFVLREVAGPWGATLPAARRREWLDDVILRAAPPRHIAVDELQRALLAPPALPHASLAEGARLLALLLDGGDVFAHVDVASQTRDRAARLVRVLAALPERVAAALQGRRVPSVMRPRAFFTLLAQSLVARCAAQPTCTLWAAGVEKVCAVGHAAALVAALGAEGGCAAAAALGAALPERAIPALATALVRGRGRDAEQQRAAAALFAEILGARVRSGVLDFVLGRKLLVGGAGGTLDADAPRRILACYTASVPAERRRAGLDETLLGAVAATWSTATFVESSSPTRHAYVTASAMACLDALHDAEGRGSGSRVASAPRLLRGVQLRLQSAHAATRRHGMRVAERLAALIDETHPLRFAELDGQRGGQRDGVDERGRSLLVTARSADTDELATTCEAALPTLAPEPEFEPRWCDPSEAMEELDFDFSLDDDDDDGNGDEDDGNASMGSSASSSSTARPWPRSAAAAADAASIDFIASDSDDSSLEPYPDAGDSDSNGEDGAEGEDGTGVTEVDRDGKRRPDAPRYAREAMAVLQQRDDAALMEVALRALPALIRRQPPPPDLHESAVDLAADLLCLENRFNLRCFGECRADALGALVALEPARLAALLIDEFYARNRDVTARLDALEALVAGARELAAGRGGGGRYSSPSSSPPPASPAIVDGPNTRRWIARRAPRAAPTVNRFAEVAALFIVPLVSRYTSRSDAAATLDLLGSKLDEPVLVALLHALAGMLEAARRASPDAARIGTLLVRALAPLHAHAASTVRYAALLLASRVVMCAPAEIVLLRAPREAKALNAWIVAAAARDPDGDVRAIAAALSGTWLAAAR